REFGFLPLPPTAVEGMLARFGAAKDEALAAYDPEKTGDLGGVGGGPAKYEAAASPENEAMGKAANAYWAAFARTGDPNGEGRPKWPAFSMAGDVVMDFGVAGPMAKPDPWKARLDVNARL